MTGPASKTNVSAEDMDRLGAVRIPKTSELVAEKLRRLIVRGKLSEGDSLPSEAELAQQFGVSRPAIREALRVLESESLVVIRRGRNGGGRVKVPSVRVAADYTGLVLQARGALLDDVLSTRLLVEPEAVRLLAAKRDAAAIDELRAIVLEEALAVEDSPGFVKLLASFHTRLAALCGSATIAVLVEVLSGIVEAHIVTVSASRPIPPDAARLAVRAHNKLLDLLADGSVEAAGDFWYTHLQAVGETLLSATGPRNSLDVLGAS
jgi:GntR family transcriptional regulator, transcriptional repressor for pyruvate dehydrogenase complex